MDVSTIDINDDVVVGQLLELHRAVTAADTPDRPGPCGVAFPLGLRQDRPGEDTEHRVVRRDGRIVAHLAVWLPTLDNLHYSGADVAVHPDHRRRGIGSALLAAGMDIARDRGRTKFAADALGTMPGGLERSEAGWRFLEANGFTRALTSINRRTDLSAADVDAERLLHEQTLAKSGDYETIAWTTRVPEELLAPTAALNSTFLAEAPLGDLDLENEKIDADRMRRNDDLSVARGLFMCGVVARPKGSEEVVANTVIGVSTEPGTYAHQWMTLVSPEHRGHRLGLRIKLENHRRLRSERPRVRYIETDNADVNAHMIAVNESLGFKPVDYLYEYQRDI